MAPVRALLGRTPEGRHWLKSDDAYAPLPPTICLCAGLVLLVDCRRENVLWMDTLVELRRVVRRAAASACSTPALNCVPRRGGYTREDAAPSVLIARGLATSHNSAHGATIHVLPPCSRIIHHQDCPSCATPCASLRRSAVLARCGSTAFGKRAGTPTAVILVDAIRWTGLDWLRTSVRHRISSFVVV
jgi:hypothetical protein